MEHKGQGQHGRLEELDTYRLVDRRTIEEMQSEGIVLEHKKTGYSIFLLSNDD